MIIAVCITTAGLSEATEIAESHFDYPFIMRYFSMSAGLLCAIPSLIYKIFANSLIIKPEMKTYFFLWALVGSVSLTSAGMIYFQAFDGVSVPTATALGGTRAVMVLILSVLLVNEQLTLWKILAVIVSILGILCYVFEANGKTNKPDNAKSNSNGDTLWGCSLCLLANFLFAFCDIVANKISKAYNNKIMGSLYYQTFQALYQLPLFLWVWFWPKTPTSENKESDWNNIWWCILPAIALTGNNASIYIGVTIKSPFYVNIGTLLGIPVAFIVDIFIHHYKPRMLPIIGAILLIISFLMLEIIQPPKSLAFCEYALYNKEAEDIHGIDDKGEVKQPLIKIHAESSDKSINGTGATFN